MLDKAKKRELLRRLLKDVSRYKLLYLMIAILTAVQMVLSLISPILMMKIIDVAIPRKDLGMMLAIICTYLAVLVGNALMGCQGTSIHICSQGRC